MPTHLLYRAFAFASGKRSRVCAGTLALLPLLSGCFFTKYKVEEIDYTKKQTPATIVIGDPQVYARASLINDRRRELEYLQQLLTNSTSVTFTPQIIRDLKTVEVLSASLGLNLGKTVNNGATAAELTQQIDAAKLQAQLVVLQKQVEGIQNATAPTPEIPALDLKNLNTLQTSSTLSSSASVVTPDLSGLQAQIKAVQDQLKAISSPGGPSAPIGTYTGLSDPRNDFADRQSYRRDIRAAISEAQLDDAHDVGGNALYRLQFQVTVLPPSNAARQWGAAMLTMKPPQLTPKDITSAYVQWLAYISRELSQSLPATGEDRNDESTPNIDYDRYIVELGRQRLFNVVDVFASRDGVIYCLEHRTAEDEQLKAIQTSATYSEPGGLTEYPIVGTYAIPPTLISLSDCKPYPAKLTSLAFDSVFKAVPRTPEETGKMDLLVAWIAHSTIDKPLDTGRVSVSSRAGSSPLDPIDYVPAIFCTAIVDPANQADCDTSRFKVAKSFTAAGGTPSKGDTLDSSRKYAVRSYSVLPSELAQRLGVTTEASQSLQAALSVGAQLSAASKGSLDTGFLSQSDTRAQALERQPMVVGFAGTYANSTRTDNEDHVGQGYFGWLFGPEFSIKDPKDLRLRQDVRAYGVNADVSLPGWWSYTGLKIETAWIANWASSSLLQTASGKAAMFDKRVTIPVSNATYESLTNFIAAQQYGPQFSQIFVGRVTPNAISACATSVTFQIGGANIWRADTVLFGGVKAKTVSVLPDMKGITAEFDMNAVYGSLVNSSSLVQTVPLTVSAEQGVSAKQLVYLIGQRQSANGAATCQSPLLVPTDLGLIPPTIMRFSPSAVCTDTKYVPLLIDGIGMMDDVQGDSENLEGKSTAKFNGTSMRTIALSLKKGAKLRKGTEHIAIESPNYGTLGSVDLTINDCDKASSEGSAKKVTLKTPTAKIAKDQKITVSASIPDNYNEIRIAVRPTKPADIAWKESEALTPAPGSAVDVSATMDLSGVAAKPGEELEVVLRIRTRPGLEFTATPADKKIMVAAGQ